MPVGRVRSTRKRTSTPEPVQALELRLAGRVVADRADEHRVDPDAGQPGRGVRGRAAADVGDDGRAVGPLGQRTEQPRDDVDHQVAEAEEGHARSARGVRRRHLGGEPGVGPHQRDVGAQRLAPALAVEPVEEVRRDVLAVDAVARRRRPGRTRAAGRAGRGRARRRGRSGWRGPGRGPSVPTRVARGQDRGHLAGRTRPASRRRDRSRRGRSRGSGRCGSRARRRPGSRAARGWRRRRGSTSPRRRPPARRCGTGWSGRRTRRRCPARRGGRRPDRRSRRR